MKVQPIMLAADRGHVSIVDWLYQAITLSGGNVKAVDNNGYNVLHWASRRGQANVISLLLSKGYYPLHLSNNQESALHLAATSNSEQSLTLLLRGGCSARGVDKDGSIPLGEPISI